MEGSWWPGRGSCLPPQPRQGEAPKISPGLREPFNLPVTTSRRTPKRAAEDQGLLDRRWLLPPSSLPAFQHALPTRALPAPCRSRCRGLIPAASSQHRFSQPPCAWDGHWSAGMQEPPAAAGSWPQAPVPARGTVPSHSQRLQRLLRK